MRGCYSWILTYSPCHVSTAGYRSYLPSLVAVTAVITGRDNIDTFMISVLEDGSASLHLTSAE